MAADHSLPVKAAVLAHLSGAPGVVALVPSRRIFDMQPPALPAFPFIRYDPPTVLPYAESCGEGVAMTLRLSAFATDQDTCHRICAAIVAAMNDLSVPSLRLVTLDWDGTQVLRDEPEADIWHGIVAYSLGVISPAP